jgi:hypothetical protein
MYAAGCGEVGECNALPGPEPAALRGRSNRDGRRRSSAGLIVPAATVLLVLVGDSREPVAGETGRPVLLGKSVGFGEVGRLFGTAPPDKDLDNLKEAVIPLAPNAAVLTVNADAIPIPTKRKVMCVSFRQRYVIQHVWRGCVCICNICQRGLRHFLQTLAQEQQKRSDALMSSSCVTAVAPNANNTRLLCTGGLVSRCRIRYRWRQCRP